MKLLHFDAITHSVPALESLARAVGADHIVLGTDYPFDMGPAAPVDAVEAARFSAADKEMIKNGTARRLLGL